MSSWQAAAIFVMTPRQRRVDGDWHAGWPLLGTPTRDIINDESRESSKGGAHPLKSVEQPLFGDHGSISDTEGALDALKIPKRCGTGVLNLALEGS